MITETWLESEILSIVPLASKAFSNKVLKLVLQTNDKHEPVKERFLSGVTNIELKTIEPFNDGDLPTFSMTFTFHQ
jgi:hypothetical protein